MKYIPLAVLSLFSVSAPAFAADLGPAEPYIERPAPPPVVERERIIERHYYPAPVVRERRVYVEPEIVEPVIIAPRRRIYVEGYPYRPYGFAHGYGRGWQGDRFAHRGGGWGRGHGRW